MLWSIQLLLNLCVIAFLTTFVFAGEPKTDKTKKVIPKEQNPNYYPVEVGNTWTYKVTANGNEATITTTIAKHEIIDGVKLSRLECEGIAVTEHLIQTDKGVFRHRLNGGEIDPPFNLLPYPAKVGSKWKGNFIAMNEKGDFKGEILAEETIDVPAGKFKTVRIRIVLNQNDKNISTEYWFAKDVGFVKQRMVIGEDLTIVLELEKYAIQKVKASK